MIPRRLRVGLWFVFVIWFIVVLCGCVTHPHYVNIQMCQVAAPPGLFWEDGQPASGWFEPCGEGQLRSQEVGLWAR